MTRAVNSRALVAALAIFATSLGLLLASNRADAATLSPTSAFEMSSASISGNHIYWFQRRWRTPRTWRGYTRAPGRILRRALDSNVTEVAYRPPVGSRITAFNVRGGRVAVGLGSTRSKRGRSAIVELVNEPTGLTAKTLLERFGGEREGKCDADASLLNIESDGAIIVEDSSVEGRGGKCELMRRQGQFRAFNPDGTQTDLSKRTSGWSMDIDNLDAPSLKAGPSHWYALRDDEGEFFGAGGLLNVRTGATVRAPLVVGELDSIEFAADGRALLDIETFSRADFSYAMTQSATNLNDPRPIERDGSIVWLHVCGEKLLEISRREPTRKSRRGGGMWNLYLRTFDGTVERRLPQRLRRATAFDTCNADVAVFHRDLRKRRARQFAVQLSQ